MAKGWDELERELDCWSEAEPVATCWWRDDDAVDATPALERLVQLRAPLALAVVPRFATQALADAIRQCPLVRVVQHGWSHENHAPANQKKAELHASRTFASLRADLTEGARTLRDLFGDDFLPLLVPPWNRIAPALRPQLAGLGICALSTFGPRNRQSMVPGLPRLNTHVDILDWRGTRGFRGVDIVLADVVRHLRARRAGRVDAAEPTGLLSHHLVHDEGCWSFIEDLIAVVDAHPAAGWIDVDHALKQERPT